MKHRNTFLTILKITGETQLTTTQTDLRNIIIKVMLILCLLGLILLTGCTAKITAKTPTIVKSDLALANILDLSLIEFVKTSIDFDGDGLTNEMEKSIGTNPRSVDSDGDSISDYLEHVVYKTNPKESDKFDEKQFSFAKYISKYDTVIKFVSKDERYPDIKEKGISLDTDKVLLSDVFTIDNISKEDYCVMQIYYPTMLHLEEDVLNPKLYIVEDDNSIIDASTKGMHYSFYKGKFTSDITEPGTYVVLNDSDNKLNYTLEETGVKPMLMLRGFAVNELPMDYKKIEEHERGLYLSTNIGSAPTGIYDLSKFNSKYITSGTISFDFGDLTTSGMEIINITNLEHPNYTLHPNKVIENGKISCDFSEDTKIVTVLDLDVIKEKQLSILSDVNNGSQKDTDGDGLSDLQETLGFILPNGYHLKLDSNNPDMDNDGILDGDEIIMGGF